MHAIMRNGVRATDDHCLYASLIMAVPERVAIMLTCADVGHHCRTQVADGA
jgi:hypothetical protein